MGTVCPLVSCAFSRPLNPTYWDYVADNCNSSAVGDPAYKSKPMNISKTSLTKLLLACELPSFTLIACGVKRFHLSYHIQYDEDGGDKPVALLLLLRIARNSQSISIAMRIRLDDLATVVFLTSMTEETGQKLRRKCIERRHLLAKHPLYFLVLIYEDRCFEYKRWFDDILEEINVVESATGMTRNTWKMQLSPRLWEWFSDYDNLLRMLYASNTELSHFDTVTAFSIKFGDFLLEALKVLEELREEVGLAPLQKREFRCLRERIAFTLSRCDLTADKTKEMLERVKGQINVVRHIALSPEPTYMCGARLWNELLTALLIGFFSGLQSCCAERQQDQSRCCRGV